MTEPDGIKDGGAIPRKGEEVYDSVSEETRTVTGSASGVLARAQR